MQPTRLVTAAVLTAALNFAASSHAASIKFTDATFNPSDYGVQLFSTSAALLVGTGQCLACGNPGAAATATYTLSGPNAGDFVAAFMRSSFSYDPSVSGAINAIDVSLDRYFQPFVNGAPTGIGAFTLRTFVSQGGNFYQAVESFGGLAGQWTTLSATGLSALDFGQYDFTTGLLNTTIHPNFATGGLITFGFAMRAAPGAGVGQIATGDLRADNWVLAINSNQVPEPGTLGLLAVALLGIGAVRRRAR